MQNNSLFKTKIIQFIDFKGISRASFYRQTGITRSTLDKKTGLSEDNLTKFFATYPEVNPTWLLTGEGKMLKGTDTSNICISSKKDTAPPPPVIELSPEGRHNCIIADVKASAGFGSLMQSRTALDELPTTHVINAPQGLNIAFQIEGDSMYPTIRHLDYVVGTKLNDIQDIRDGHTYIIVDREDGVLCKRLYKCGNDFEIVSDNPDNPPYKRSHYDIIAVFRAFTRISRDFRNENDELRRTVRALSRDMRDMHTKITLLENPRK